MAFQALRDKATGHSQGLAYLTDIVSGGGITAIDEGVGISVNNTNPLQPIVSTNLVAGANITLTPPVAPNTALTINAVIPAPTGITGIGAGANISVDNTNPSIPVVSATYPVPVPTQYPAVSSVGTSGAITLTGLGTQQELFSSKTTYIWDTESTALAQIYYNGTATMTTTGGHDLLKVDATAELASNPSVVIANSVAPNYIYVRTQNEAVGFCGVLNFIIPSIPVGTDTLDIKVYVQATLTNDDYDFAMEIPATTLTRTQASPPP